jgi:hypothetical protein
VYYKKRYDHPNHLKKIFKRCRKYGISLNPKKSIFSFLEGKLLGHIISKYGVSIDRRMYKIHHADSFTQQQEINAIILWED